MIYLIDVWFDWLYFYLWILYWEIGEICVVLEEDVLDELCDQGGFDLYELNLSELLIFKELVCNLFFFCYVCVLC